MAQIQIDDFVLEKLIDDIRDIRIGVGALQTAMSATTNEYGQRLRAVEVRSGFVALVISAIAAAIGWSRQ